MKKISFLTSLLLFGIIAGCQSIETPSVDPTLFSQTSIPTDLPTFVPEETTSISNTELNVPFGFEPTLDGQLAPGEWDTALVEKFTSGGELLLMSDGSYLYLGIRTNVELPADVVASVFLYEEDQVSIYHSSASLGTAIFNSQNDQWQMMQGFRWFPEVGDSEKWQDEFLQKNNWLANLGTSTSTSEMEYKLKLPENPFSIAAAYLLFSDGSNVEAAWWPETLNDDCRKTSLLQGDLGQSSFTFTPQTWMKISTMSKTSVVPLSDPQPDTGEPLVFRAGEVSTKAIELSLAMHPSEEEIYFTRLEDGKATLWVSHKTSSGWDAPEPASFSGEYDDIAPFIRADGQAIYFSSNRPSAGETVPRDHYHLWMAEREGTGWSPPVDVALPLESISGEMHASLTLTGVLYYMADYPTLGGEGLYRSEVEDGVYKMPEKIDLLNNSGSVVYVEPYISSDEKFLLFYSAGRGDNLTPGGQTGDIYISFRQSDGSWQAPQNLGTLINSTSEESTPSLSPDGKYLFFASNRDSGGFPDIYWVDTNSLGW